MCFQLELKSSWHYSIGRGNFNVHRTLSSQEIEVEDVQLAIKLSDERTLGIDPGANIVHELSRETNHGDGRGLLDLINKDAVNIRYPTTVFSQRCYTLVPGSEAFENQEVSG